MKNLGRNMYSEKDKKISVIIPTYNRAKLLECCLRHLESQDFPKEEFEVLICDDGSMDSTKDIARDYDKKNLIKIHYLYQPHKGVSSARNLGIRNARGRFLIFVADDYCLDKDHLKKTLLYFKAHKEAQVMSFKIMNRENSFVSNVLSFWHNICIQKMLVSRKESFFNPIKYLRKIKIEEGIRACNHLPASGAAIFKSAVFDKAGMFDERLKSFEDYEYGHRLSKLGIPIFFCPFVVVKRGRDGFLPFLRKIFLYNLNRCRLREACPEHSLSVNYGIKSLMRYVAEIFYRPLFFAIQADNLTSAFLYLPFIFLINLSSILGVFYGQIYCKHNNP